MGASAKADRAGGPADLSRCASQPEALIPCSAPWWRCLHCGCDDYLPYREGLSGLVDERLIRCANCKSTHSAPDPSSPKALRWQIGILEKQLAEYRDFVEEIACGCIPDYEEAKRDAQRLLAPET